MQYTEEILKKVKSFGALQYPVERIISILNPENPEQFKKDFADPDSPLFVMYQAGFNAGQYRLDVENFQLAEIETKKQRIELQQLEKVQALRQELFGI